MIPNHSDNGAVPVSRPVRQYDETFKRDAVRLPEQSGGPRAQAARDPGVSGVSLATWQARHGSAGPGAAGAADPAGAAALLAENARLKAELEHITRQRDILKKAMAIVSQERRGGVEMIRRLHRGPEKYSVEELCEAFDVSRSGVLRAPAKTRRGAPPGG
jgi:transposase